MASCAAWPWFAFGLVGVDHGASWSSAVSSARRHSPLDGARDADGGGWVPCGAVHQGRIVRSMPRRDAATSRIYVTALQAKAEIAVITDQYRSKSKTR